MARTRADSILREMDDGKYMKLRREVVWAVRYKGKTYAQAADENCLTLSEVNTLLNKPRKGCESTD